MWCLADHISTLQEETRGDLKKASGRHTGLRLQMIRLLLGGGGGRDIHGQKGDGESFCFSGRGRADPVWKRFKKSKRRQ